MLAASILGLMPTGINVAVWHSLWAVEHLKYWKEENADRAAMLRMSRRDLGIGYVLSAVLGVMLLSLGAVLLRPRGLVPNGVDVALTISEIYTEILGAWMFPVFMIAAFAAMFSTVYSVMDGFPRAFSTLLRRLFPQNAFLHRSSNPSYWMFMVVIFAFSVVTNTLIPNSRRSVGSRIAALRYLLLRKELREHVLTHVTHRFGLCCGVSRHDVDSRGCADVGQRRRSIVECEL